MAESNTLNAIKYILNLQTDEEGKEDES